MSDQLLEFIFSSTGSAAAPQPSAKASDGIFDALLMHESGGRQLDKSGAPVTSKAGATGIAQVMPETAPEAAALAGLPWDESRYKTDADYNRALGKAYFEKQLADFGNTPQALAAYNAGPGAVRRAISTASKNGQSDAWLNFLPEETRNYVPSILSRAKATPVAGGQVAPAPAKANFYTPENTHLVGAPPVPAPKRSAGEAVADTAIGFGASLLQGIGLLTNTFGADNAASKGLREAADDLTSMQSPARQAQRAARAAEIKFADEYGSAWDEVVAYAGAFADAPVETVLSAIGTSAPTLLVAAIPGLNGAAAARLVATGAMGAAQGGGSVKGQIYEAVYNKLTERGIDPDTAAKTAAGAQAYNGPNLDQILLGMGIGGAAATTGFERALGAVVSRRAAAGAAADAAGKAAPGIAARIGSGIAKESPIEGLQGGQERVASNVALQREGYDVPTFQGATGQAALEAMASAPLGAAGGLLNPVAAKAQEPNTPLSKAATAGNVATEAQGPAPAPAEPSQRLAELEAIAKGSADTQNADGQTIPGQPGRIFTAEEKAEYDALRAQRDATPGAVPDDITPKAFAIRDQLRADRGVLDALRADTSPTKPQALLKDLSIATSKSAQPAMREQALARVEMAMDWAASNPAPTIEADLDALPGLAQGDARPDAPRPTATQLRAGADRDAALIADRDGAQASQAGNQTRAEADRRDQAAIDIESSPSATPDALDRAVALRQQAAALRRRADEADAQPGAAGATGAMTERDRASIDEQRQINLQRNMRAPDRSQPISEQNRPAPIAAAEQAQLEASSLAGKDADRKKQDDPRQVVVDRALRNVEERGGVASPAEARIFQEAGVGKPYDRVDESLADELSTDEKLTQATGIALGRAPRESTRQGQQSEADLVAQEQRDRSDSRMQALAAERKAAQAGQPAAREPAAAPAADEVIGALKTIPALRTAEQKTVVDAARRGYTAEQMRVMNDAAVNPANLSATDKLQLQQMREARKSEGRAAEPQALPDVAIPAGAGPAFLRKRKAQIEAAAAQGYETVERRDGVFVMHNAKTGAEVRLSGRADAALAREAVRKMADERAKAGPKKDAIEAAAAQAAQSPANNLPEPTDAQKEAGNYKKGLVRFDGLEVSIETPKGAVRRSKADDPNPWEVEMPAHYGYIRGTTGSDGDHVDLTIGPAGNNGRYWVINQNHAPGGKKTGHDEHKLFTGVESAEEAVALYKKSFANNWGDKVFASVSDEFDVAGIKAALPGMSKPEPVTGGSSAAPAADVAAAVEPEAGSFTVRMGGKDVTFERRGVEALGEKESPERDGAATKISKRSAALIKAIARALGKKVVFFADVNGVRPGDGFVVPNDPDTIYLNEVSTISPLAVMGHEFLHTLRQTNPKAWAAIADVVKGRVKDPKGFRRDYYGAEEADARGDGALDEGQGGELEELVSDLGGNLMTDPKFWEEIFAKIRAENGAESKGIIAKLIASLQAMLAKVGEFVKGPQFKADRFVTDLEAIRGAYRDGLAAYLKQSGESKAGIQAEVLKSAQRDQRVQAEAMSMTGYHFSREPRKVLSSATHGQGLQDANREQFQDAEDPRIRQRIYFYVDKGTGITPLPGLGTHAHRTKLTGVYDMNKDALGLRKGKKLEAFESAVLDAGFQGYLDRRDGTQPGVVIMLGKRTVEPEYLGIMGSIKDGEKLPGAVAPEVERQPISKGLMSKEMNAIEVANIPGAKMRAGILTIPADSREQANAEMARIGSPIRFSAERIEDDVDEVEAVRKKYEGTDKWMKAPNGRATNLTERQWLHVRTPSFKKWFGDWEKFAAQDGGVWNDANGEVSKAVGKNGEPLVVYHGTDTGGFTKFSRPGGKQRGDLGIFTTDDRDVARSYVHKGRARDIELDQDPRTLKEFEELGYSFDENESGKTELTAPDGYYQGEFNTSQEAVEYAMDTFDSSDAVRERPGIYALFINIRSPNESHFEGANWDGSRNGQFIVVNDAGEMLFNDDGIGYFDDRDDAFELVMKNGGAIEDAMDHYETTDSVVRDARRSGQDGAIIRRVVDNGGGLGSYSASDLFVALDPNQVKSADFNSGEYSASNDDIRYSVERTHTRVHDFEVSTRDPSAKPNKNFTPEDSKANLLISDFAAGLGQEKWLGAVTDLVEAYPNYRPAATATTPEKKLERMVRQMVENLVWLHDQVPADTRNRSKLWYDGARAIADRWVKKYGITDAQAAGILAVLSPQKDWFMNVSLANRVADILTERQAFRWSKQMDETASRIFGKEAYDEDIAAIRGQTLQDIDDPYLRAMWLRVYDQAHNPSLFYIVSPEGDFVAEARTKDGTLARVAWGGNSTIAKAVSIFEDGSFDNISTSLGRMHKVRNFYNNILVPNSPNGHVTIDTHAVAAALLRALSGNSLEVTHNFGGPSSAHAGLKGSYALYEEAYRRAAAARGILPREMQSITWEAIRGLYVPTFKAQSRNVEAVDAVWGQYRKGRLSYENARQQVFELGGRIDPPSWEGRDPGAYVEDEPAADDGDLAEDGASAGDSADDVRAAGDRAGASARRSAARITDFDARNIGGILEKTDWAILTAENPRGQQATPEFNEKAQKLLRADLRELGAEFRDIEGSYGQKENSIAVAGITEAQATELGRKYDQDSILTRKGLIYQDGSINPAGGVEVFREAPEDFYSRIGDTIFRINIDFDTKLEADVVKSAERAPHYPDEEDIERVVRFGFEKASYYGTKYPVRRGELLAAIIDGDIRFGVSGNRVLSAVKRALDKYAKDAPYKLTFEEAVARVRASLGADVVKSAERYTETDNFKRWFADSVMTETGKPGGTPLKLYHGGFPLMDQKPGKAVPKASTRGALGYGFYMTPDDGRAQTYAGESGGWGRPDGKVTALYARLQNPLFIPHKTEQDPVITGLVLTGMSRESAIKKVEKANEEHGWTGKELMSAATKAGYDGVVLTVNGQIAEVVTYQPTQVKSADGNDGGFSWSPDIRKSTERDYPRISDFKGLSLRRASADINATADSAFGSDEYRVLPGVREVPFADFLLQGEETGLFNTVEELRRIGGLAEAIKKSGGIEPLFISKPASGQMFLSEGQHRARALKRLGYSSVPARIIEQSPGGKTQPTIIRSAERPWYSQLARAIEGVPARLDNQSAVQWAQWLKANASKLGVKADEVTWSGIEDFLKLKGKEKLSKAEIGAYLADGGVRVEEVVLGDVKSDLPAGWSVEEDDGDPGLWSVRDAQGIMVGQAWGRDEAIRDAGVRDTRSTSDTKYGQYTMPGGSNYREVLLTLPEPKLGDIEPWTPGRMKAKRDVFVDAGFTPLGVDTAIAAAFEAGGVEAALRALDAKVGSGAYRESQKEAREILRSAVSGERKNKEKRLLELSKASYKSSHWDTKNVVAHVRLNDRVDSIGRKTLFVEELQSDFGADNRKQRANIEKAVDGNFEAIIERMKKAGVLEIVCD